MNRILTLIGILNQLTKTRTNRSLKGLDLPIAQFIVLDHFSQSPKTGWTVTGLTDVFEMNQPAMTKTTQLLLRKEFLFYKKNKRDKRIKIYYITTSGLEIVTKAWGRVTVEFEKIFSQWKSREINQLKELLERLKRQFDKEIY